MKKKVLGILLTVCMVLTLMPAVALATDATSAETLAMELNAMSQQSSGTNCCTVNDNTVTMTASVTLTDTINITNGTIVLDLNGKTITGKAGEGSTDAPDAISVSGSANVTIMDKGTNGSIVGGNGAISYEDRGQSSGGNALSVSDGNVLLSSGTFTGGNGGYGGMSGSANGGNGLYVNGGTVTLSSGTFNGGTRNNNFYTLGKGIIGTVTIAGGSNVKGGDTANPTTVITGNYGNYQYLIVEAPPLPTAADYAEAEPAAASGTDYVLDDTVTPKTLHIKTAKGVAWWSANGRSYLGYTVYLDNDIDVSGFKWMPVGNGSSPFTGTFDGQGHTLENLTIEATGVFELGVFSEIYYATVKNLAISGSINASRSGDCYVGSIVGYNSRGTIAHCSSSATVTLNTTGNQSQSNVGGIVGSSYLGVITNCYNTGAITATSAYITNAGGIAGDANSVVITNCFNTGIVSASGSYRNYSGGIAGGASDGVITNCFNTGAVSASDGSNGNYSGGISGVGGSVNNCYFKSDATVIGNNIPYSTCTATGCGTFVDNGGTLTAGTAANCGADQTFAYNSDTLLGTLSDWVHATNSADYCTWAADNTSSPANSGYPVFGPAYVSTPPSSGGSGGGGSSVTPTTPSAPVLVDGKTENIGKAETTVTENKVIIDGSKLTEKVSSAKTGGSVIVPVSDEKAAATAEIVVKNVEDMAKKDMTLTVQTGGITYDLPTAAINTATILSELGATDSSKVPVNVTITKADTALNGRVEQVAENVGATVIGTPISFTVTANYNGHVMEITDFDRFISRVIDVPAEQAKRIATAVVTETDGSVRHVPTYVSQRDGKWFARINSRTNSTYALIENSASFTDAAGKWYQASVEEMASRKIVNGTGSSTFAGEANITRAEFAAILVRALGLPEDGTASFNDVNAGNWYYGAVGTAVQYGLVDGYTDGSFKPSANITRQEAMVMLQRAAKIAEYTGMATSLSGFSDASAVSGWAQSAAEFNVGSGFIQGNANELRPTDNITRAESAVVLLRLLQKSELVDIRTNI